MNCTETNSSMHFMIKGTVHFYPEYRGTKKYLRDYFQGDTVIIHAV